MKKTFLIFFASFALLFLLSTGTAYAAAPYGNGCTANNGTTDPAALGIVPCGVTKVNGVLTCPCIINHFFIMIKRIYIFITWVIALPLAGLLIVIGGVLLIISGANQNMFELGKRLLWGAAWGLVLVFGAWVVVSIIFMALGYTGSWFSF